MKKEDTAMFSDYLPVNSLPFLRRMLEILEDCKANNPEALPPEVAKNFRRNLWLINAQTYGQIAKIDMQEEYNELHIRR